MMTKFTRTLIATTLVSLVSLTAFASNATASEQRGHGPRATGPVHFICSDEGAQRIENGLSRLANRLELNTTQTASFEVFKTSALAAQSDFSQICTQFKPVARNQANNDTDLVDRLNNRQAIMGAQLNAMANVLPDFEIFYDSLTDEQKQQMRPPRNGQHRHGPNGGNGQHAHADQDKGSSNS